MNSTGRNGGLVNCGLNDAENDSSLESDDTEDSSEIFHSTKSNISSTESATEKTGRLSEYENVWRMLEKTKISGSNDDAKKERPALEYFEHPDILTEIQQRSSSQLPRWSETVKKETLVTSTPELTDGQTSYPFPEMPKNNLSAFGLGIVPGEPFYTQNPEATAFPTLNQPVKTLGAKNPISTKPLEPTLFGSQNLMPRTFGTENQESKAPESLESSFDFGLRQNKPSRPPFTLSSSKPTSPRETIANRFKEQLGNMDGTGPLATASNPILRNNLFDIHRENERQWNIKDEGVIDAQARSEKRVQDDAVDSLNIPSFGSSGKGQTRYLQEATKPKIFESGVINPTMSICHQTSLHQNIRTEAKCHQFADNQQLSTAEFSTGPYNKAENCASEVPISTDLWECTVKNTSDAVLRKKSGKSNSVSETSKDFMESPVQARCAADFLKSGNSNSVSKDFLESPVQAPSGADFLKSGHSNSVSKDFLESPVQAPCFTGLHKKSGNSNSASEDTSKDFLESPVQVPCGADPQKKTGNSNNSSEAPVPETVSKELGSLKISPELEEDLSLALLHQRFQGLSDISAPFTLGNHSTLNSLTGDIPTKLSVYDDGAGYSGSSNEALEFSKIPSDPRFEQLRQENRVEMSSIHSGYSNASSMGSYSSDAASNIVPYNNGTLGIPNAQQPNVNIQNVNNLYQEQYITDDGTEHLIRHTDEVMESRECNFDISHTTAWKNVLDTDKIVFLVGFSQSFKEMICLKFYQKYKPRFDVFRLNSPEDMKICYKRSDPFVIFMEDAFGPLGIDFESKTNFIKDLSIFKNLKAALLTMDPLSYDRNEESLKKCINRKFADHLVHLEEEKHLLSEDEKREILVKTSEIVKEKGRSLTQQDIDKIMCFENPLFFDTCDEFVGFDRHDKNVRQFFSLPLDCLVGNIRYLREKWLDGYYVLRLVAFHKVFGHSEKDEELSKYLMQSIHGSLPQISNQLVGSYLKIQHSEAIDSQANLSSPKFVFRHRMMQYAVLCTETDKEFLIAHCPIGFLVDVIGQMTNMREISFEDKKRNIAKRFIQEILKGEQMASVVINEIWNSEEFLEYFKQEWETVKLKPIVSNSDCKSNFLYLAVFNKSPKLLYWILKTCKEQKFRVSSSLHKRAIFATCVVGHFEHFKLLMGRIKDVDGFCQTEFKDCVLIPKRTCESLEIVFDETKCYSHITHTAVAFNRLDILDCIRSCGQNVNYRDSQGYTSLHVACFNGSDIQILEYLKENKGDVANVTDKHGNTCLHAACCRYDNIEIVTWLVKDFPKLVLKRNSSGQTPLHTAVGAGNTQIVELLLKISSKFQNNCLLEKDMSGCTVLHLACKVHNNLQMVEFLLERQPSLITIQDHHGNTALHVASQTQGNMKVVEFLISKGMDINIANNSLRTPLHTAYH